MGMDQSIYTVPRDEVEDSEVDFEYDLESRTEIFYWRKFYQLHDWMLELYISKGGVDESFNCCPVRLRIEDLVKLEQEAYFSQPQSIFFNYTDKTNQTDVKTNLACFIPKAKEALDNDLVVFYSAFY